MKFLNKFADLVVRGRWYLFGVFIAITIACTCLIPMVGINYDMTKYLPNDSKTKIALNIMEEEFGSSGNASIMVENVTIAQAEELKNKLLNIDNVSTVVFDSTNNSYYKDNNALLKVFFDSSNYDEATATAISEIRVVCEEYSESLGGQAVTATSSRNAIGSEMLIILGIAVVIVLAILTLTSKSWLEPLVYLCVIGCAILINMGSNLLLGEISFITQSISAIMLIALEMDYCIVLCSRFREEEEKGLPPVEAMKSALSGAFTAIIASSLTVMAGLIALMFMDFSIGFDIGAVLAKGVFISILAVLFFMPSIILIFSHALKKTSHKSFLPKMDKEASFANKAKCILPAIFVCFVIAGIVLQSGVQFNYIANTAKEGSQIQIESSKIEKNFGKQNSLVVIVPNGKVEEEKDLFANIINIEVDGEKYINSASSIVSTALYTSMTYDQIKEQFSLDDTTLTNIYTALNKQTTDSVYMIELIDYFHNNPTLISSIAQTKQVSIDTLYAGFNDKNLYTLMNLETAKNTYPTSTENIMSGIYASILGKDSANITSTDVLPNYAIIEALYTKDIDNYKTTFEQLFTSEYKPFAKLTKAQVKASYNLPQEAVDNIFKVYNISDNDTIRILQLVQALNAKTNNVTIIEQIATTTQTKVEEYYTQATEAKKMFVSDDYNRMIFNINLAIDDEKSISFIEELNKVLANSTFTESYIANETSNLIETSEIFKTDRLKTDLITIIAIILIILLSFRSLSVPLILVFTIQGAIWINLAISNVMGESVFFVCYLLAMAIQMGATIDYGILISDRYIRYRKTENKLESMKKALNASITTVLTSGLILIFAAFTIHFVSSTALISEIGLLIGRGALISVIAVIFILPSLLLLFDKVIEKTTLHTKFLDSKDEKIEHIND